MSLSIQAAGIDCLSPDDDGLLEAARLALKRLQPVGKVSSPHLAEPSAIWLSRWGIPSAWIAASLMIPAYVQDPDAYTFISTNVSPEVAQIVRRYQEMNSRTIPMPAGRRGAASEPYRQLQRLFMASYLDEAVTFLSIANMLSILDSIQTIPPEERRRIACDLEIVLLPLLERCGLWLLRREVSDLLFSFTHPSEASAVAALIQRYDFRREETLEQVRQDLGSSLSRRGINVALSKHLVRPARAFELASIVCADNPSTSIEQLLDKFSARLAVDVIVQDAAECYVALGEIHKQYRFVPGTFRDYIGSPRFNGYCMLHSTVRLRSANDKESFLVEFYVGTESMVRANQWGRIHEWQEGRGSPVRLLDAWWHRADPARAILTKSEPGTYAPSTYTFSPVGELYVLREHGTPVDFAFAVHSELGRFYLTAEVNGVEVPSTFRLANADIVNVHIDPERPVLMHSQWLGHVTTPQAVTHIRRQLVRQYGRANEGRRLVNDAIARQSQQFGLRFSEAQLRWYLEEAAQWWHCDGTEAFFLRVSDGELAPDEVAARIISYEISHRIAYPSGERLGLLPYRIHVAQCCRPTPDDAIVGRFYQQGTKHAKVKVHRASCPHVPHDERTVELVWRPVDHHGLYEYLAFGMDRTGILSDVLRPFYAHGAYLHKVVAERLQDETAQFLLVAEPENTGMAQRLVTDLKEVRSIHDCTSRPLTVTAADTRTLKRTHRRPPNPFTYYHPASIAMDFVGRHHELDMVREYIGTEGMAAPLAIHGPWRIGKTSLLKYIDKHDGAEFGAVAVYVNCHSISSLSLETLLLEISKKTWEKINQRLGLLRVGFLSLTDEDDQRFRADPMNQFRRYMDQVSVFLQEEKIPRLVLMIDELSDLYDEIRKGKLDARIFSNLRALMEGDTKAIRFIVVLQAAALHPMQAEYPEAAGLLEVTQQLPLGPLEAQDAADLMTRLGRQIDLEFAKDAIARLIELAGSNPYLSKLLGHRIVERLSDPRGYVVRLSDVESAADAVLQTQAHGATYCEQLYRLIKSQHEQEIVHQLADPDSISWKSEASLAKVIASRGQSPGVHAALHRLVDSGIVVTDEDSAEGAALYRLLSPLLARWLQAQPAKTRERR